MRKAMIAALLLFVLSAGGVCAVASGVYAAHDRVTLTENIVYGDRAAANGLTVCLDSTYKNHLVWNTTYTMDTQSRTESEYSFSAAGMYGEESMVYSGVSLSGIAYSGMYLDMDVNQPKAGLETAYSELYNSIDPGEEATAEVYLKDYMDYYPLAVNLDFPGMNTWLNMYDIENDPNVEIEGGPELYVMQEILNYFKIPVLDEECYHISVSKRTDGLLSDWSSEIEGDSYQMWTYSALSDNACYFTFDAHSQNGTLVDTGELPDGYGIYRLPYQTERGEESGETVGTVAPGTLEMVYPLDLEIKLLGLNVSGDQTKLLLHAVENGEYILTVIDINTMTTLQKLKVMDWSEDEQSQIYVEDGYMAVALYGCQKLAVIVEEVSGAYTVRFICDAYPEEFDYTQPGATALAFDGERLALAGALWDEETGAVDTCSFFLAVYEESGLVYYGTYRNSLNVSSYPYYYYDYNCYGFGDEPLHIRWTTGP